MNTPVSQLPESGTYHMRHYSEDNFAEDIRIVFLEDLISSFKAAEKEKKVTIEPVDCKLYRHILEEAIRYFREQRFNYSMLQMENKRLELIVSLYVDEQNRSNFQAQEEIQKLKDEIQSKIIENGNLARKLREAEVQLGESLREWIKSCSSENWSECSTGTLEAEPEN